MFLGLEHFLPVHQAACFHNKPKEVAHFHDDEDLKAVLLKGDQQTPTGSKSTVLNV